MSNLPVDVRDELDHIANEIICLGALLGSARVFGDFPDAGIAGLQSLMDGWHDSLKRLSGSESPTGEDRS